MPLRFRSLLAVLSVVLIARNFADAAEWARFRGPNGSGVSAETTLPTEWTQSDENWRVKLPGVGHSSPVLWGERLFVTSGDEETGTRHILCIDSASGRTIWEEKLEATRPSKHQLNSFASSSPVVDAKRLYHCWVSADELFAAALDHDGKELWRASLGPFKAGHGYGISPILHDGLVVVGNEQQGESTLLAVDCETGAVRWRVPRESKVSYSTPCVYAPDGRPAELIFTNWEQGITAIDPKTGRTNWQLDVFDKNHVETSIGSPIVVGDLILGTSGWLGYGMQTVAVRPVDETPVKAVEVYRVDRGAPLTPTPVAAHGLLFLWADNGIVTCVDTGDGRQYWQKRVGGNYYGSPVVVGRHVYCLSADGECVVLAASRDYELVARNPLGEGSHATPAAANKTLFLRTFSQLIAIGGKREK